MQATVADEPRSIAPRLHHVKNLALFLTIVGGMGTAILANRLFEFDSQWVWTVGYPALFLIGVIGAVAVVLPIPILPLVFAGASLLDPYGVAFSAAAGMTVGMGLSYFVGNLGHNGMSRLLHEGESWCVKLIRRARMQYQCRTIIAAFLIAAIPNPVYSYSGLIAGSLRVSVRRFCLGTFCGKTIQATVVALAGFYAGSLPIFA